MNVSVPLEHRFSRLPDGSVWTQGTFRLSFWHRYLDVFDGVRCVARVRDVPHLDGEWHRADGEGVSFASVPYFLGTTQFLRHAREVHRSVRRALQVGDAAVLRIPGTLGTMASSALTRSGYPYGVEVVADPFSAFAPGAIRHPLRPIVRAVMSHLLRRQCAAAIAACYVTERSLQRAYPGPSPMFSASSLDLADEVFLGRVRARHAPDGPLHLVFVGSLSQYYKGPDVLIRALALCVGRGLDLKLTIVGDGRHRTELQTLCTQLGCESRVRFTGQLASGAAVLDELDRADVFVLPSRSEGLPRALLEAMARGLPCIGTDVGGIPEVLPAEAVVPPGNAEALADKLCDAAGDPHWVSRMSSANVERVNAFRSALIQQQRVRFYRVVRQSTERWLSERGRPVQAHTAVHRRERRVSGL